MDPPTAGVLSDHMDDLWFKSSILNLLIVFILFLFFASLWCWKLDWLFEGFIQTSIMNVPIFIGICYPVYIVNLFCFLWMRITFFPIFYL